MRHFAIGGSTAQRTLNCPSWRVMASTLPSGNGKGNEFADRGTLLHNCIEKLILDPDLDIQSLIGASYNDITLDYDMLNEALQPALTAYDNFANAVGIQTDFIEATLEVDDEMGGTADILFITEDAIGIIDHKFGSMIVSPEENSQALFYLMCARDDPKWTKLFTPERKRIIVGINQPKQDDSECLTTWETTIERLNEFTEQFYDALDAEDGDNPQAGSHCQYCPAVAICPARTGAARKALMIDPNSNDAAELAKAMAMVADVESWCKAVKKTSHEQAELGMTIKGFKLVAKRATRKWIDDSDVMAKIRKMKKIKIGEVTDVKVKTVPQLEKYCKKEGVDFAQFDAYYSKVSSGTTLTSDTDKRPAVQNVAAMASVIKQLSN